MRTSRLLIICASILLSHCQVYSQGVAVNGSVSDSLGKPLSGASVTLTKANGNILAFAITNASGSYKILYNGTFIKDSLHVVANTAGYTKQFKLVTEATQTLHFRLSASFKKLPDVQVKNNRSLLKKEGDTLSYDVSSFTSPQDRTIGDVIKKLPGVEVAENGQISYGGKPINRFYIDGDNVLDGKYNIATKSVPNDMVAKVQVLENHQPVKVLKDLVQSDQAAMNLVLKDKARVKVMTSGDLAIGTPDVYNTTVNTMLFNKKVKFINYVKLNNSGSDIADDVINHFGFDNQPPPQLLSASTTGNPDLPKKRYLFNNVGLINANDFVKLKNELELKINCFYLFDRQLRSSNISSTFFLPNDTIRYAEKQDSRTVNNTFNTTLSLNANKKKYYLNNVTTLENTPSSINASLEATTNSNIYQQLSGTTTNISNRLNFIKKLAHDRILEGSSFINNIRNPSTLQVWPGLYASEFNNGNSFAALSQQAAVPTFYTDNYIRVGSGASKFKQSYKMGFNYQDQQLNSSLEAQQFSGNKVSVGDSFVNHLNWSRFKAYLETELVYKTERTTLDITVPVTLQDIRYKGRTVNNQLTTVPVTPSARLSFVVGKESSLNFYYSYNNNWGNINEVYDSYIMTGYRGFYTNSNLLTQTRSNNYSGSYQFKNTLKIFFFSVGGSYSVSEGSTISDTRISSVIQQAKLILFDNVSERSQLYGSVSKYIFPLHTTISGKASWGRSVSNQLQNGELLKVQNDMYAFNTSANTKVSAWMNIGYTGSYNTYNSRLITNLHTLGPATPSVKKWQHELNMDFNIGNDILFRFSGQNNNYQAPGSLDKHFTFLDAYATYKFNRLKTDIELSFTNIAGVDTYSNVSLTTNSILESTWNIRPRMVMLKFYFRF